MLINLLARWFFALYLFLYFMYNDIFWNHKNVNFKSFGSKDIKSVSFWKVSSKVPMFCFKSFDPQAGTTWTPTPTRHRCWRCPPQSAPAGIGAAGTAPCPRRRDHRVLSTSPEKTPFFEIWVKRCGKKSVGYCKSSQNLGELQKE